MTTRSIGCHLPLRLHHYAFVVRDQEANRRFFEDILGIPLAATWCERTYLAREGREVVFCHTFFALADGSALAFFQFADPAMYERTAQPDTSALTRYRHIALKIDSASFAEIDRRLTRAGIDHYEADHGYCRSMYMDSPDGLRLELTVDSDEIEGVLATKRASAREDLARWLAGNHESNNPVRPSQMVCRVV